MARPQEFKKPVSLALRIDSYSGPFVENDLAAATIVSEAKRLIQEAKEYQLDLDELQLDFDCPQQNWPVTEFGFSRFALPSAR